MAEISDKPPGAAWLTGLLWFVAFETAAFFGLRALAAAVAAGVGTDSVIVGNWVQTMVFVVGHLLLVLAAMLVLSNRLPRYYRGQVLRWFYLALVMTFGLLIPLFS